MSSVPKTREFLKGSEIDNDPIGTVKTSYRIVNIVSFLTWFFWVATFGFALAAIFGPGAFAVGTSSPLDPGPELARLRAVLIAYGFVLLIFLFLFAWNFLYLNREIENQNGPIAAAFKVGEDFSSMYQGKGAGKMLTNGISNLLSPDKSFAKTIEDHYRNSKINEGIKKVFTGK